MQYLTANHHYKERFGCKVYKLGVDAGFTCPNRDGTIGTGGCIFCDAHGGSAFTGQGSITQQLELAKQKVSKKIHDGKYIAYFQSFTNTYAPCAVLEKRYREAMEVEDVVALAIGTRPDCLDKEVLSLLARLNLEIPIYVELGLQTVKKESIDYIRRGYENDVYFEAVRNLRAIGVNVITHIIVGLPHETRKDVLETTRQVVAAGTNGVKFHLLHILKNTDLEKDYLAGKFECLSLEEYADIIRECISILPPDVAVHRITGDGAKRDLVAPLWSADKKKVLNYLNQVLSK